MSVKNAAGCILKTKLYAPRVPEVLSREKLLRKISDAGTAKLTTVVAGAGYGKSTLAASFIGSRNGSSVWYQLEETDRDLHEFISYLLAGIRMRQNDFGEETLGRLKAAEDMANEGETVIFTFISEIDALIKDDLLIVLDDFQNVNESLPITSSLDLMMRHMPQNVHIVILTRARPNLDLPVLAARRELVEIKEEDLRFTPHETAELFTRIFGLSINREEAEKICDYTEGWITGLVLFCLAAKERGGAYLKVAAKDLDVPPSKIAEYLSGVVFEGQSEPVREFMTKTSLLSRMNPVFCDRLLDTDNSGAILEHLVNSRIFTLAQDDRGEWFRYHHVFKSFLREKLSRCCGGEDLNGIHLKAALLWDELNETEQALHHYMEAGDFESAAGILEASAPEFMDENRISFLHDNLQLLPEEIVWKHRRLAYQLAEILYLQGDYDSALKASEHAAALFKESGDVEAMLNSMIRTGLAMFELGRMDEYEKTVSELFEQVPVGSTLWYSLSAVLGKYSIFAGKCDLADRFTANALAHIYQIEDKTLRSNLLFSSGMVVFHIGDYGESYRMIGEAYELAESVGNNTFAMNMICVLSPAAVVLGHFEEALRFADKGLAMRESMDCDIPFTYLYLVSRATALSLMGERDAAGSDMEKALEVSRKCGYGAEVMYAHYFMAGLHMYFGSKEQALRHYGIAKHIARDIPFVIVEHLARLGEIQISFEDMGIEAAIGETRIIASYVKAHYNGAFATHSFIILAYLEQYSGHETEALGALNTAAELTESSGAVGLWKWAMSDNPEVERVLMPLIVDMFSRGEHVDLLSRVLKYIGPASIPLLTKLSKLRDCPAKDRAGELSELIKKESMEPLHIRTFGTFEVSRGEEKIRPRDWKSRKALAVLKYLSAQEENRGVSREVLMELLWPGSMPESASKNLGVALSYLRKILEPDGIRGESSYIVTDGNSLKLELGKGGSVDFRLFRKTIREAAGAEKSGDANLYLEKLKQAEEFYRGEFMGEDLYDDWCRPEREQLHNEYLDLLIKIANEFRRRNALSEASTYLEKAINADPGREDLYRGQMEICAGLGNRSGIERAFSNCSEYLRNNYNVEPSPETVNIYHKLRGD